MRGSGPGDSLSERVQPSMLRLLPRDPLRVWVTIKSQREGDCDENVTDDYVGRCHPAWDRISAGAGSDCGDFGYGDGPNGRGNSRCVNYDQEHRYIAHLYDCGSQPGEGYEAQGSDHPPISRGVFQYP